MKKSELKQIIKEEIQKTLKEENDLYSQASDKARKLMLQLEDLALNGEIGNQDIDELRGRLRSARAKMFANRKSPEDRQAAAQKALKTKAKNEKDLKNQIKKSEKYKALTKKENKERKDANKLPLEIPTYGKIGATQTELGDMEKYYNIEYDAEYYSKEKYHGGYGGEVGYGNLYGDRTKLVLDPKYKDKSFAKANIAWNVWEKTEGKL
jgi:hypothetical protein